MSAEFRFWRPAHESLGGLPSGVASSQVLRVGAVLLRQICDSNIEICETIADFVSRLDSKGVKEKTKRMLFAPAHESRAVTRGKQVCTMRARPKHKQISIIVAHSIFRRWLIAHRLLRR